ncbi:MAG: membrane protein insertase YidC [Phycisphaerae bacterium]|nr:membrane protein insertase YidC [Phycisphaerae bacterium]
MKYKIIFGLVITAFVIFCGVLVLQSGLFGESSSAEGCFKLQAETTVIGDADTPAPADEPNSQPQLVQAAEPVIFGARGGAAETISLGSLDKNSGFEFLVKLNTRGAAIESVTLTNFDDRNYKNPQPLVLLKPIEISGTQILSMANAGFVLGEYGQKLPLDKLYWKNLGVETAADGSQKCLFEAVVYDKKADAEQLILRKTYMVRPNSFDLDCALSITNDSDVDQVVAFELTGLAGIDREDVRSDSRKVIGAFLNDAGQFDTDRKDIKKFEGKSVYDKLSLEGKGAFLWEAVTNKYFAGILAPQGDNDAVSGWAVEPVARFYNPDGQKNSGDENIATALNSKLLKIAAGDTRNYKILLYAGPKDKRIFDKNELYRTLIFSQTIDFMGCCICPASILNPLAFGILWIMDWIYKFIPNYGIVIIILVFFIRLMIHPVTKKSQISMSKFGKIAPQVEQIKNKYANDKVEMNRRVMALYKEQGASPIMGMLPMLVQMPIWISLYSAISSSVALRGQAFLPFWITDLSVPDALFHFPMVTIPLVNWQIDSFNLLPILMGVAFYLQQKMMPTQAATNPQMAQQQKMMMIMMPLLFPLMLYKAPSALNLYIMASTFAGVIEQKVIKKHIKEQEEREQQGVVATTSKMGGKTKKKKPKPFFRDH